MIWTISMLKTIIQQNGMLDILLIHLRQCGITLANEHSISSAKCQKLTVSYAMQDGWIAVSPIIIKTCIKMFQIHSIHQFINLFNGSLFFPKREMTSYKNQWPSTWNVTWNTTQHICRCCQNSRSKIPNQIL